MKKPIPKKPVKVSKSKKTLPVEIDWGSGMKDRLRYISPKEEALVQRYRSTDAERYYGGIRAYPDPADTAAGGSLGVSSGTTTGTTVANGGGTTTAGGTTTTGGSGSTGTNYSGSGIGNERSSSDSGGFGTTSTSTTSTTSDVGAGVGGDSGSVTASAAAEPDFRGGIGGGVASVESNLQNTESNYRNSGVNSIDSGRITSGNIVTTTSPNYSQSYSYSNVPAPVTATGVGESPYDNVPTEATPGFGMEREPAKVWGATEALGNMLGQSQQSAFAKPGTMTPAAAFKTYGSMLNPTDLPQGKFGPGVNDIVNGPVYTSEADRIAANQNAIKNNEGITGKITDRLPQDGGVKSLDQERGIDTVSQAENIPKPVVAQTLMSGIPSGPTLPNASMSQGKFAWHDAYKATVRYAPEDGTVLKVENVPESVLDGAPSGPLGRTRGIAPQPQERGKLYYDRVQGESVVPGPSPSYEPTGPVVGVSTYANEDLTPATTANVFANPDASWSALSGYEAGRIKATPDAFARFDNNFSFGGGSEDSASPSDENPTGIATIPNQSDAMPDAINNYEGGVANLPLNKNPYDKHPIQGGEEDIGPGYPGGIEGRPYKKTEEEIDEGKRAWRGAGFLVNRALPGIGTLIGRGGSWAYGKFTRDKLDAYANANQPEKAAMEREHPELVKWASMTGLPASGQYGYDHYTNWADASGLRGQPDRRGGQDGSSQVPDNYGSQQQLFLNWSRGIGIPSKGDPDYTMYIYWRNAQKNKNNQNNSKDEWGWS